MRPFLFNFSVTPKSPYQEESEQTLSTEGDLEQGGQHRLALHSDLGHPDKVPQSF
jgi:hypothetical protein